MSDDSNRDDVSAAPAPNTPASSAPLEGGRGATPVTSSTDTPADDLTANERAELDAYRAAARVAAQAPAPAPATGPAITAGAAFDQIAQREDVGEHVAAGDAVVYRYIDPTTNEVREQIGFVVDADASITSREGDDAPAATVAWSTGGVSGPILLHELARPGQ